MNAASIAAIIFTIAAAGAVAFQLALALGAPWGEFAMAGKFPGRLPAGMRVAAVIQAVVIALLAAVVLARAGLAFEAWSEASSLLIWAVVAFSAVSLVLNSITSSAGERRIWVPVALVMLGSSLVVALAGPSAVADIPPNWGEPESWTKPAAELPDPADFVEGVDHPYWPLVPGTRWVYEAETTDGLERIEVEVLDETRTVAGIECVVVRDTVTLDGELTEDTYDWYAQDRDGNVWYMGEDSTEYEGGESVSTAGSWEAGADGALPGIKLWAEPHIRQAPYYQEFYEGEAEDLGRDISLSGKASVPFGEYNDLLVVEEWNKLDPGTVELKYYAEGVGTVKEEVIRGGSEIVGLTEFEAPR